MLTAPQLVTGRPGPALSRGGLDASASDAAGDSGLVCGRQFGGAAVIYLGVSGAADDDPAVVARAAEFGDREALVDGDVPLSFAELAAEIERAARALIASGSSQATGWRSGRPTSASGPSPRWRPHAAAASSSR